jgi:hypothetical protein
MRPQNQFFFRSILIIFLLALGSVNFVYGQYVRTSGPVPASFAAIPAKSDAFSNYSFAGSNAGPARAGAIINYALIAPIMILGTASAVTSGSDASVGLGAAATIIAGIGIPIGGLIGGITRSSAGVRGSIPLRIVGWVGYGLTLADAITMLALSEDVEFGPGLILPVVILGTLSTVCFGIDNSRTVSQVKNQQAKISLLPSVYSFRDNTGKYHQTVGIRINF